MPDINGCETISEVESVLFASFDSVLSLATKLGCEVVVEENSN